MKKFYLFIVFIFVSLLSFAQPANDDCGSAIPMTVNTTYNGTTSEATESNEPCGGYKDVWYKFVATATTHTVIVTPTNAPKHIILSLSSDSCGSLNCSDANLFDHIESTDDNAPLSITANSLTIGTTYYVIISPQLNDYLEFTIKVTAPTGLCDNTTTIGCNQPQLFSVSGNGNLSTISCTDGTNFVSGEGKEVVYKFTPAVSGDYEVSLTAGDGNFVAYYLKAVSQGCSNTDWTCLGNLNLADGNFLLLANLSACTEYYLLLDASSSNATAQTFTITPASSGVCLPACTSLTTPTQGATEVLTTTNIAWQAVNGAAGYKIKLSTVDGVLLNTLDIGTATSYQPAATLLPPGKIIYVKITPYTCKGEEINCSDMIFTTKAVAPPSNDDCANAITLTPQPFGTTNCTGGLLNQTTAGAMPTSSSGITSCPSTANQDDIYYKFTTTNAGNYTIRFCNITAPYGQIGTYVGFADFINCSSSTYRLYCGGPNISNGSASFVMDNLAPNTTYYFAVWSPEYNNAYSFDISIIAPNATPPNNDECAGAIVFPSILPNPNLSIPADGTCATVSVNTVSATASSGFTSCGTADDDVWYTFTVPQNYSVLKYQIIGSSDIAIHVYSGNCGNLTPIGNCYEGTLGMITGLIGGNTYYLRTYTKSANIPTSYDICLRTLLEGDNCENAVKFSTIPTDGSSATLRVSTLNSRPSNAPLCTPMDLNNDIWASFTVPNSEDAISLTLQTVAGTTKYNCQIFSGSCGSLTSIRCIEAPLSNGGQLAVNPGETYYIRLYSREPNNATTVDILINTAVTYYFSGGDWEVAANWTPRYIGGTTIPLNKVVNIDGQGYTDKVITNYGSLGANALFTAPSLINYGTFSTSADVGFITVVNNGEFNSTGILSSATITNNGTAYLYSAPGYAFGGTITNNVGGSFFIQRDMILWQQGIITNHGNLSIAGLLQDFRGGSDRKKVINSGTFFTIGSLDIDLENTGTVNNNGGVFFGKSKITSNADFPMTGIYTPGYVSTSSLIDPSTSISIDPSVSMASTTTLQIQIHTNQAHQLKSSGSVVVNGILKLNLRNATNGSYAIVLGSSVSGNFTGIQYSTDNGISYSSTPPVAVSLTYGSTQVTVNIGNVPSDCTFTAAVDNNWSNAANWSCGRVPLGIDSVIINDKNVVIDIAASCRGLKLEGTNAFLNTPSVSVANMLTVNNFDWRGGAIKSPLTIASNGVLVKTGSTFTLSSKITNHGTINNFNATNITLMSGAAIENQTDGIITNPNFDVVTSVLIALDNYGKIILSQANYMQCALLKNYGIIDFQASVGLSLYGNIANQKTIFGPNATVVSNGFLPTIIVYTPVEIQGNLDISGVSVTMNSGAALTGAGSLTTNKSFSWNIGSINCPITIASGGVLNTSLNNLQSASLSSKITNYGTINNLYTSNITFLDGAIIENQAGGVMTDPDFSGTQTDFVILNNYGTIRYTNAVAYFVRRANFNNYGTIDFQASGAVFLYKNSIFGTNASFNIWQGVSPALFVNAPLEIQGNFNAKNVLVNLNSAAASLSGTSSGMGSLTIERALSWGYGSISCPVTINVGATAELFYNGSNLKLKSTFNNNGTTTTYGNTHIDFNNGIFNNNSVLQLASSQFSDETGSIADNNSFYNCGKLVSLGSASAPPSSILVYYSDCSASTDTIAGVGTLTFSNIFILKRRLSTGMSPGTLTINPSVSATSTAVFDMEITGGYGAAGIADDADKLVSVGNIEINGTLLLRLTNPEVGIYTIIDGTSLTGNFSSIQYSINGGAFTITQPNNVSITYNYTEGTVTISINGSVLPIELTTFQAQNTEGGNLLTWRTATEVNASHFDIERSTDGKNFEKIGETKAQGKAATYEYTDRHPLSITTYYRLKINDLDDKSSYSNIVSLSNTQKGLTTKVYPNPFGDDLNIEVLTEKKSDITIVLTDILGRQVYQSIWKNTEGVLNLPLSTKELPNGTYFLKVKDGFGTIEHKVIKNGL